MRGILGFAGYVPHHRLDRSAISAASGTNAGKGTRSVASYDEDTTTMGVEAARLALRPLGDPAGRCARRAVVLDRDPAYLDKTNATASTPRCASTATCRRSTSAASVRSGVGALRAALDGGRDRCCVVTADLRTGLPTQRRRVATAATARPRCSSATTTDAPVIAELPRRGHRRPRSSSTAGARRATAARKQWEERFGEVKYVAARRARRGTLALEAGRRRAPSEVDQRDRHRHARPRRARGGRQGSASGPGGVVDDLAATVGNTGAAHPALLLARALERAEPGQVDRARRARRRRRRAAVPHHRRRSPPARRPRPVADAGRRPGDAGLPYGKFLVVAAAW